MAGAARERSLHEAKRWPGSSQQASKCSSWALCRAIRGTGEKQNLHMHQAGYWLLVGAVVR